MAKKLIDELLDTVDTVDSVKNSVRQLLREIRNDASGSEKKPSDPNIVDEPKFVDNGNVVTESTTLHYTSSGDYKNSKFMAPQLYRNPEKEQKGAIAQQVAGYGLFGTGAIISTANVLSMVFNGFNFGPFLGAAFFGVGAILLLILGFKGTARAIMNGRFKEYVQAFGQKTILSFKELGEAIGKNESYARDDVRKMIEKKLFKQGHIDSDGQVLITADATYKNYLEYESRMKLLEAQDQDYEDSLREAGFSSEGIRIIKQCET